MNLELWAQRWSVSPDALEDLRGLLTCDTDPAPHAGESEAAIQTRVRLEASNIGARLWRNNVGAGTLDNGSFVRWGLCNDTQKMNAWIKSSDLIGIKPVKIEPYHVGQTIGQFVAREVKAGDWKWSGSDREVAQMRFLELVISMGGDAAFARGEGTL